jgi:hypothetical protein
MYFAPVLDHDDGGHCDRHEDRYRSGDLNRYAQSEKWDGDESFAESECGTDDGSEEHDCNDVKDEGVDHAAVLSMSLAATAPQYATTGELRGG